MYDRPIFRKVRSVARKTGINKLAGAVIGLFGYETAFKRKALAFVRPGDCVWDVGANLGLYSEPFLDRVGPNGRVVAFEPSRECFSKLDARLNARPAFVAVNAALGSAEGSATLYCANDPLDATHTLSVDAGNYQAHAGLRYTVPVHTGEMYAKKHPDLAPNVIKIDVEGFESAVMDGMSGILSDRRLRGVFLEIHFTLLESQGLADAPNRIAGQLRDAGFDVKWSDPSHIVATR